jgi:hypothetical protein
VWSRNGTEAGLFHALAFQPWWRSRQHIEQAHRPNEFVLWIKWRNARLFCFA